MLIQQPGSIPSPRGPKSSRVLQTAVLGPPVKDMTILHKTEKIPLNLDEYRFSGYLQVPLIKIVL